MRTFTLGTGNNRKYVMLEVRGARIAIVEGRADGLPRRSEKELKGEAQARAACEKMARELANLGYVEQTSVGGGARTGPADAAASKPSARPPAARPAPAAAAPPVNVEYLFDDDGPAEEAVEAPPLPRASAAAPAAEAEPKKKKKSGRKRKRKKAENGDGLDKRVVGGVMLGGAALVVLMGSFFYDAFLRPPSIVGHWKGSKLEYEISGPIVHTQYALVLGSDRRASLTLQEALTASGTYAVQGDRLTLTLRDEDGEAMELQYKFSLGRAVLDLYDPDSGQKAVQLVRQSGGPPAGGGGAPPPEAPKEVAAAAVGEGDQAADERLASVAFAPKDGAFKLRHPPGWKVETGSRPDNTYSWARFTQGSARIQVNADVAGSLMSGSDHAGPQEEGSEFAPVHGAHEMYARNAAEEFNDYRESAPTVFKGSPLGEGRISAFSASGGGLFGSKLRGYRVTLLTNNRRVTILCSCPEGDFAETQATFLAVCRSLGR